MFRPAGEKVGVKKDVLLAATPGQMRGILDNLTDSAERGKIGAAAFGSGLFELGEASYKPNYTGRNIRNALKNPMVRGLVDNPGMAEELAENSVGMLGQFGIDTKEARGYIGPGMAILRQAKEDGILRPDVTDAEVATEIQRPLYGAMQGWLKDNKNNPKVNSLVREAYPGMSGGDPSDSDIEMLMNADDRYY